jgi:hypothetical protein
MSLLQSTPSRLDIRNLAGIERCIPLIPLLETCKFYCESTVVGEMNSDLAELASARCDIPDDHLDVTLLRAGEVRKLKTLCLYFLAQWIDDQQVELDDRPLAGTDISVELKNLKEELHRKLPEVDFRHVRPRASDILVKWALLLLEGRPHRHWAFRGDLCLLYISANDGEFLNHSITIFS